jgi:hypothetical protein
MAPKIRRRTDEGAGSQAGRSETRLRDDGAWRWLAAGSMTREAALLLFNSVHLTVSTVCRISFVCTQARIETE